MISYPCLSTYKSTYIRAYVCIYIYVYKSILSIRVHKQHKDEDEDEEEEEEDEDEEQAPLHHAMLKQLRAFQALDVDGDGAICHADLSNALSNPYNGGGGLLLLGASDVASMISAADLNGDGKIDLAEFQHQLSLYAEERSRDEGQEGGGEGENKKRLSASTAAPSFSSALRDIFRVLNADQDGVLCRGDLRSAMAMCGESVSDIQLDAMISAAAGGSAGPLDFNAFSRLLLHWLT